MTNDQMMRDGDAENEGAAIDRANSYRTARPNGRPKLKRRSGPLGPDGELEKIVYPLTYKIPRIPMPQWLKDQLK